MSETDAKAEMYEVAKRMIEQADDPQKFVAALGAGNREIARKAGGFKPYEIDAMFSEFEYHLAEHIKEVNINA